MTKLTALHVLSTVISVITLLFLAYQLSMVIFRKSLVNYDWVLAALLTESLAWTSYAIILGLKLLLVLNVLAATINFALLFSCSEYPKKYFKSGNK